MTRRSLLPIPIALICLVLAGSMPAGQGRAPTISDDLKAHPAGPHTHRVIVQGGDAAVSTLRKGVLGRLRRELKGAVALDVTDVQLDALRRNSQYAHISGDVPVVADMAVTNTVTAATSVWQGTPGLLGL